VHELTVWAGLVVLAAVNLYVTVLLVRLATVTDNAITSAVRRILRSCDNGREVRRDQNNTYDSRR
jgi:hypothetical protein